MAGTKLAKVVTVARKGPSFASKLKEVKSGALATQARQRARAMAEEKKGDVVSIVSAGAYGYAEQNMQLPTIMGVDASALYGLAFFFGVPMLIKGKAGKVASQVGTGLCSVAAYKMGTGQSLVSGEWDPYPSQVAGDDGWTNVP